MKKQSVEAIISALNSANVRYLVAGGMAVAAHGYLRFTADVDLILDLEEKNVAAALSALEKLGYTPRAPVPMEQFADSRLRQQWVKEKGLTVFSLQSSEHPTTEVDLFVEPPLDFERAYESATRIEFAPALVATFVSFDDLISMKRSAARPQDVADIEQLQLLKKTKGHGGKPTTG